MYNTYAGKPVTDSNESWHRPQSTGDRLEEELITKSTRALVIVTDPFEKFRWLCMSHGATGILAVCRNFRKLDPGSKQLNKDELVTGIKRAGIEFAEDDADDVFAKFDPENTGLVNLEDFIRELQPPMSEGRRAMVEQAFRKMPKSEDGSVSIEDLRKVFSVECDPRYMSGEDTAEFVMNKFLANFNTDGTADGEVTLEDFMNYYSSLSMSIDNDGFFDLMMRTAFKL